jgi:protein-S-isoprenylcysteine O-methyltransferase Ste14
MNQMLRNTDAIKKKAFLGLTALIALLWLALFLPAGTLNFWQAWVFWLLFAGCISFISYYFLRKDLTLIASRLKIGTSETDKNQKVTQAIISVSFILLIFIPAVDRRFQWSNVPFYLSFSGDIFVVFGFLVIFLVFNENRYTSVLIEVESKQKVISSGPYSRVRHPMYSGALLMLFFIPLALGSIWGLLAFLPIISAIPLRILAEEKFLQQNLDGYLDYCKKVRYRLIPLVW